MMRHFVILNLKLEDMPEHSLYIRVQRELTRFPFAGSTQSPVEIEEIAVEPGNTEESLQAEEAPPISYQNSMRQKVAFGEHNTIDARVPDPRDKEARLASVPVPPSRTRLT